PRFSLFPYTTLFRSVGLGMPDGETWIELVKYHSPLNETAHEQPSPNTLGIIHICFAVEDLDAIVEKLKKRGTEIFSEIEEYEERDRKSTRLNSSHVK